MTTFHDQLQRIHEQISIKDEDRKPYLEMFASVRDWLMKEMCEVSPLFKKLYKGTELFGSYSNNVRIIKPNEFDVSILMQFPCIFNVQVNPRNPGFVTLSKNNYVRTDYDELFTENRLSRTKLQDWIQNIIKLVLSKRSAPYHGCTIKYSRCKIAHNIIYAQETIFPKKTISFDFVPSIVMLDHSIAQQSDKWRIYNKTFLGIPNYLSGDRNTDCETFQFVNPAAEHKIMWDKKNLKMVYRLLKSLRDQHQLPRLKSYFFTAIFLLEVDDQPSDFWLKPIGDILIHMLRKLNGYFQRGFLPFYWNRTNNVLSILRHEEKSKYGFILSKLVINLENISVQKHVTYATVEEFFKTTP